MHGFPHSFISWAKIRNALIEEETTMMKNKIIVGQIFTDELSAVFPQEYKDIDITWLDAGLHWDLYYE